MLEFEKIGKYVSKIIEQEEKEMGVMFDQYIKNVNAIDIEMLPDDSQVKIQVRVGEDIHLFLLEGKGAKILAENYVKICKLKQELVVDADDLRIENAKLKQEIRDISKKYKEQEAKIAELQIEKARLEYEKKNISEHDRKLNDNLRVKAAEYETLKADFDNLHKSLTESLELKTCAECDKLKTLKEWIKKLRERNKELNQQIDEMVLNANKKKEEDAKDQKIRELEKALSNWKKSYDCLDKALHDSQINCEKWYNKWVKIQSEDDILDQAKEADEEPSSRRDILRCAEKCVCGKREQDYGTPESNFQLIADLWNDYLKKERSSIVVDATDVAMMMALLKIARIRNGGGTGDSFVDLAGYAACGGEINAQKKATKTN